MLQQVECKEDVYSEGGAKLGEEPLIRKGEVVLADTSKIMHGFVEILKGKERHLLTRSEFKSFFK